MEKHKAEMARLYEESQTPEWMKPLKKLHQRRKSEQSEKIEAERRKAEEERQRFEAMPAWKKQLIYKKKAKSAENLFSGCDSKNVEYDTNSGDRVKEKAESTQGENSEVDAENVNGVNDENGNGISENENCDDGITNGQVETPVDENEQPENDELKDTGNGDDHVEVEDLDKNYSEAVEVGLVDEVSDDGDQEPGVSEEENYYDESDEARESEESQILSDDENEVQCLELDENETVENEEKQMDGSEQENEEINDKDNNEE
ncbi:myb-like protein X [Dendronephthya gigantea]|uniref:myb-like protein X n=1 Tax=Dendronephthya gigantea TaxID=151771 RepID=UPI00106B22DE|nr:myb-like protein X [Dendronephthya gigantea]